MEKRVLSSLLKPYFLNKIVPHTLGQHCACKILRFLPEYLVREYHFPSGSRTNNLLVWRPILSLTTSLAKCISEHKHFSWSIWWFSDDYCHANCESLVHRMMLSWSYGQWVHFYERFCDSNDLCFLKTTGAEKEAPFCHFILNIKCYLKSLLHGLL